MSIAGPRADRRDRRGFTLVEMMMVVLLIGVMSGMAVLVAGNRYRSVKADSEMRRLTSELRRARETATSLRRDVEIRFTGPDEVSVFRREIPASAGVTLISTLRFEGGVRTHLFPGLPDTPDRFGQAAAVDFGGAATLLFRSEGIFTDDNANLDPRSGTIFIGVPSDVSTARAVTIFGPSGAVRGYRWDGREWQE